MKAEEELKPIYTSKYKITETGQVLKRTKDELKDEMKDKISMALKDPVLQQGFEVICKNLAELEKEKCELLGIIQGKDKVIQELKKELNSMLVGKNQQPAKAKEIIEKMKCCENCRHYSHTYGHCYSYDEYQNCKSLSNWRLAEC